MPHQIRNLQQQVFDRGEVTSEIYDCRPELINEGHIKALPSTSDI
jgi:hypothetical protein